MAIGNKWAGKLFGTNTGNLYATLEGDEDALKGRIHLNDPVFGLVVYGITATFDGQILTLQGEPEKQIEGVELGNLQATAELNSKGELEGEWSTNIGSAGTFILFPHDRKSIAEKEDNAEQEQLHTARHNFGAVAVDRGQLTELAEEVQRDFKHTQVVVTVLAGTEKSRFLEDFKKAHFKDQRVTIFKIYARERQTVGIDRIAVIEFGPEVNFAMTQGADEAWVLGMLEKLKNSVEPLERKYATSFKKFGFGINQVLLVGAVIYLPSLTELELRAALMIGVLAIIAAVTWAHSRYLPFAALFLGNKPKSFFTKVFPSALSWIIAVTSAVAATLLATYLQGLLPITP
ncbi:hypothetical protein NHN26_00345 [Rhodovulum tesquicola]|uniref:hypothetical protein n=1 Tax=Rhodovulum tesquicola TaxID=540254 RepID=UPI002096D2DB|nr:hypothetical protein [Rhodovulum tesquicola]MCO8143659.1 hypothetical protein [Rhodovulum tesquicola]